MRLSLSQRLFISLMIASSSRVSKQLEDGKRHRCTRRKGHIVLIAKAGDTNRKENNPFSLAGCLSSSNVLVCWKTIPREREKVVIY